jgi:hypothetical protein
MESFIRIIHFGVKLFLLLLVAPTRGGRNHSKREREREGDRVGAERQSAIVVGKYDSLSLTLSLSISLTFLFLSVFCHEESWILKRKEITVRVFPVATQ